MPDQGRIQTRVEICIDSIDPDRIARFWSIALGYQIGDWDRAHVYLDLVPPTAGGSLASGLPVVYLQKVPDPKRGKNRSHIDIYATDPAGLIAKLTALGGLCIGVPQTGSEAGWWQVMTDQEGNELCICIEDRHVANLDQ